jgi:hypothetical protein
MHYYNAHQTVYILYLAFQHNNAETTKDAHTTCILATCILATCTIAICTLAMFEHKPMLTHNPARIDSRSLGSIPYSYPETDWKSQPL